MDETTIMNDFIRSETQSEEGERVISAIGINVRSGIDVLNRQDYATREEYVEACARYDIDHSNPALVKKMREISRQLSEREEKEILQQQKEDYKEFMKKVTIQPYEKERLEKQARDIATEDLGAGKTDMRSFGAYVREIYDKLENKLRAEKASAMQMNSMLRRK